MSYKPFQPNQMGTFYIYDINIREIIPFIDWKFFFLSWRLSGRYDGIEKVHYCPSCHAEWLQGFEGKNRDKAEEALKLYQDAQDLLFEIIDNKLLKLNGLYGFYSAYSSDDDIFIKHEENDVKIPTLRQQRPSSDGFCYSLADFLDEKDDFIGIFANTVVGTEELATTYEKEDDVYKAILIKTLADRLGEATAEWLHWKVRKEFWGYAVDENLTPEDMLKTRYVGIRPAVGYPSLPDQSVIFDLDPIVKFDKIGISLTENGAMFPNASVSGLIFAHPQSKYFMVGKVDNDQVIDYANRKGIKPEDIKKWLSANIS